MFLCQCEDCQRTSGAGHAAVMIVQTAGFSIDGPTTSHSWKVANGNTVSHVFCSKCGNPLANQSSGHPEIRFIMAGGLDDKSIFKPSRVMHRDSARPWDLHDPEA